MRQEFFDDIAQGRIGVRAVTIRDVYRAMHLIRYAGVVLKSQLRTYDALIASTCLEYALEKQQKLAFCTSDLKMRNTLLLVDAFRSALDIRYFDPQ
jgi:predicted nucleic acid-binding protein